MSLLLNCQSLSKSYGPRQLFKDISISFDDSERTGLIGPNGSGKSTLLKILAGLETADSGNMTTRRQLRLGYVPQEDLFEPRQSVLQVMHGALADAHLEEHERSTRIAILMDRIGFTDLEQQVGTLSGGWRKRLSIARQLIAQPDLLLLDEPTNHLDLQGIIWLEELLAGGTFSFLLVSHDRYLLENATNRLVELNSTYADGYLSVKGTYSEFLLRREEYLEAQSARQQALASRVRREVEWLKRGAKARTTKAKGRIQEAGRMMEDLAQLKARNADAGTTQIDFAATDRKTRKLAVARDVAKGLGGRNLFEHLNLVLSPGMKLGLLGRNGSGKTTLIRLLVGEEPADRGEIWRADGLKVVVFDQSRRQLDKSQTLRDALSPLGENVSFRGSSMHVSAFARMFLFRLDQLDLPVGELSGGEQSRVLIARLMLLPADVLILDEPTNDLDIPSLEVLEESLMEFAGALVLVTHDRYMLDRVSSELLALDGQGGAHWYADLAQWEAAQDRAASAAAQAQKNSSKPVTTSTKPAGPKRLTYVEQRELEKMEAAIMAAEQALHESQEMMSDPRVASDHVRLREACTRADEAQQKVSQLYARWEELEARK